MICHRRLYVLKLFRVFLVGFFFLLLMLSFLFDIPFFSISFTLLQAPPRSHSVSLRSYVRVALDIADISHCLQSKLGFLFMFSNVQLSVYKWALVESFLLSILQLAVFWSQVTGSTQQDKWYQKGWIISSCWRRVLFWCKRLWVFFHADDESSNLVLLVLDFFSFTEYFSCSFNHSKLIRTSLQLYWMMHAEAS